MNRARSISIARLAFVLLLSGLITIGALPDSLKENAIQSHEHSSSKVEHSEYGSFNSSFVDLELCRPGLDCISVAVFDGIQNVPEPNQELTGLAWSYADLNSDSIKPRSDLPPPRV